MKKLIIIAVLAFGSFTFSSCTKENVAPASTHKANVLADKGDLGWADGDKGDLGQADGSTTTVGN